MLKIAYYSFILIILMSCKSYSTTESTIINIYNSDNQLVLQINDANDIAQLKSAFLEKQKTFVKILPVYEHTIEIELNNTQEVWLVNAAGYMQNKSGNDSTLYRIQIPPVLAEFFNKQ